MVAFGASKIIMGPSSELGPVDPQLTINENGVFKRFSVHNLIKSYQDLFGRAISATDKNIQPFLQQLANYDERAIEEYKAANELAEDISVRSLSAGMMNGTAQEQIKTKIKIFLTPEHTKAHGRPIYRDEAKSCGLNIENMELGDDIWKLSTELYTRTNNYVSMKVAKCVESREHAFAIPIPR